MSFFFWAHPVYNYKKVLERNTKGYGYQKGENKENR